MFIRFLTGRRAGQIAEMKFADAQPLLADRRAEKVNYDNQRAEPELSPLQLASRTPATSTLSEIIAEQGKKSSEPKSRRKSK